MKATITIQCDNAAFSPIAGEEIARILRDLSDSIETITAGSDPFDRNITLRDVNGNRVGSFTLK